MRAYPAGLHIPYLAEPPVHSAHRPHSICQHRGGGNILCAAGHRHTHLFSCRYLHIAEHNHRQLDYHGVALFLLQGQKGLSGDTGGPPYHDRLPCRHIFPA